jgi:hypothetical protein
LVEVGGKKREVHQEVCEVVDLVELVEVQREKFLGFNDVDLRDRMSLQNLEDSRELTMDSGTIGESFRLSRPFGIEKNLETC